MQTYPPAPRRSRLPWILASAVIVAILLLTAAVIYRLNNDDSGATTARDTDLTATGRGNMRIGDSLTDIRARHADFPSTGENSGTRTVYTWRDCSYIIDNGALVEIAPFAPGSSVPGSGGSTVDGITAGSSMSRAVELYGKPATDVSGTAIFVTDRASGSAYRIKYTGTLADGTITAVMLFRYLQTTSDRALTPTFTQTPTSTIASHAALGPDTPVTFGGVPGILAGMPESVLDGRSWDSNRRVASRCNMYVAGVPAASGFTILTRPGGAVLGMYGKVTDRGIRGQSSTYADIKRAYSDATLTGAMSSGGYFILATRPGEPSLALGFGFDSPPSDSSVVGAIRAGNVDFAKGFELCSGG